MSKYKTGDCPRCGRKNYRITKGVCHNCYRKYVWPRKKATCIRCKRLMFLKGRGLCGGCYNIIYQLENAKAHNYKKWHNIDLETYRKITSRCMICGFDKIIDLHHLDNNKKNSSETNLIGLCPNHHKMLHTLKYREEIFQLLKEKGFEPRTRKLREDIRGSY